MKPSASVIKLFSICSWIIAAILVILPFHAFITVWLSSLLHHYTLLRLWKEFLLAIILIGSLVILVKDKKLRHKFFSNRLVRLMIAYLAVLVIGSIVAFVKHAVTAKAMWYGLLVDSRFILFFLAVLIVASKDDWLRRKWQVLLLAPAVIVAAFAVLQYLILPYDVLKHFGYDSSTILPYETINHNIHHIRVLSTLRGANPLGAYLILPICTLSALALSNKKQRLDAALFGTGLLLALIFSFSRSAWFGAGLGIITVVWLSPIPSKAKRNLGLGTAAVAILLAIVGITFRNNLNFQNTIFHTDKASTISISSNEGHSAAFKAATKDIWHHPLGSGVGTAGPQSVYNQGQTKIAENYFLQIGQEAGVLGAIMFIGICIFTGKLLFHNRADPLALALFASLLGLILINLLSHAWTDDTLAYIWWGLAAIALTPAILKAGQQNGKNQKAESKTTVR